MLSTDLVNTNINYCTYCFAFSGFVVIFIRYKHVKDGSDPGMLLVRRLNYWSLWAGGLSCLGMSMVANFQVSLVDDDDADDDDQKHLER